jgi:hypothetical protein
MSANTGAAAYGTWIGTLVVLLVAFSSVALADHPENAGLIVKAKGLLEALGGVVGHIHVWPAPLG